MNRALCVALLVAGALVFGTHGPSLQAAPGCTTLQDGILTYSPGHYLHGTPISPGFDPYGYNYQAHMFSGSYANVYLGAAGLPPYGGDDEAYLAENPAASSHWSWPYRAVQLVMKWNDAWLATTDCDGDGKLDRHYGLPTYRGSGAWTTNHMSGVDTLENGKKYRWTDFVKIVAAPEDATTASGNWYAADGSLIGPVVWGDFAIVQEITNDRGAELRGVLIKGLHPGFGWY